MLSTADGEPCVPQVKIFSNILLCNFDVYQYLHGFQMLIQCLNDLVLDYALTISSSIPYKCISNDCSFVVYNKLWDVITSEIEKKGKTNFTNKKFAQILQLEFYSQFETPTIDDVIRLLNEMGYTP